MDVSPPSDADRDTALEDIKQLLSAGTITTEEFANRSRTIASARTLSELTAATRQPVTRSLGSVPGGPARPEPEPLLTTITGAVVNRPFAGFLARAVGGALARRVVVLIVSVVLAGGGLAYVTSLFGLASDSVSQVDLEDLVPSDPIALPDTSRPDPRLHTTGGFDRFRDAVDDEIGRTRFVSAVVYPTYASIELPVPGRPDRSQRAFYDGRLNDAVTDGPRSPGSRSADLADVDVDALVRTIRRAPRQLGVDRPSATYVIFDTREGRAAMSVYVSNRANDTGYWTMRLDGRTVSKHRP